MGKRWVLFPLSYCPSFWGVFSRQLEPHKSSCRYPLPLKLCFSSVVHCTHLSTLQGLCWWYTAHGNGSVTHCLTDTTNLRCWCTHSNQGFAQNQMLVWGQSLRGLFNILRWASCASRALAPWMPAPLELHGNTVATSFLMSLLKFGF